MASFPPEIADVVDELPFWSAPFGLKMLDLVKYRISITALDLGCGTGFPLIELAFRLGPTSRIFGLDPWSEALEKVKRKLQFHHMNNVELVQAQAESIPLPDQSVDLIISNNGINNVSDLTKCLSECRRILKSEGQFLFSVNLEGTMKEFYNVFSDVLKDMGLHECVVAMKRHIRDKRRPLDELLRSVQTAGFTVISSVNDHFCYHFSNGTAMLSHSLIRNFFLPEWKALLPSVNASGIIAQVEKKMNVLAEKGNGFHLTIPFAVVDCRG